MLFLHNYLLCRIYAATVIVLVINRKKAGAGYITSSRRELGDQEPARDQRRPKAPSERKYVVTGVAVVVMGEEAELKGCGNG